MILARAVNNKGEIVYPIEKQRFPSKGHFSRLYSDRMILSASYVSPNYPETYDDLGFIFETNSQPVFISPVDHFMLLNGSLPDYEQFLFSSIEDMLAKFPTLDSAYEAVSKWRMEKAGFMFSSGLYCSEIAFEAEIPIKVLALFGDINDIANKYNLPIYKRALDFFDEKA